MEHEKCVSNAMRNRSPAHYPSKKQRVKIVTVVSLHVSSEVLVEDRIVVSQRYSQWTRAMLSEEEEDHESLLRGHERSRMAMAGRCGCDFCWLWLLSGQPQSMTCSPFALDLWRKISDSQLVSLG